MCETRDVLTPSRSVRVNVHKTGGLNRSYGSPSGRLARHVLPIRGQTLLTMLRQAGDLAIDAWQRPMAFQTKGDGTPVTLADLAAETALRSGLESAFPRDAVVTEESGGVQGQSAWWVVDPIDGTSCYIEGLPHWGPVLARLVPQGNSSRVDCGAIWLPRLAEHYHVEHDEGEERPRAWFNGTPLTASAAVPRTLYLPSRFHMHFRLDYAGKTRCLGGTAAHLALVARGAAEAVIVAPGWKAWDTAAGLALIAAVGGVVARLPHGGPIHPVEHEGEPFVAGTAATVHHLLAPGAITALPPLPRMDSR